MSASAAPSIELIGALYSRVGDFRALPDLLGLVAENTDADAVQLGLDLGYGYRHDCFGGDPDWITLRPTAAEPARRDDWIDRHALPVGTAGRRGQPRSDIVLYRDPARAAFKSAERERVSLLLPHINHALTLAHRLEISRQQTASVLDALQHSAHGVLLLTPDGELFHANARARAQLDDTGIACTTQLKFANAALQTRFDQALRQTAQAHAHNGVELLIPGAQNLLIRIHPPTARNAPAQRLRTVTLHTLAVHTQALPERRLTEAFSEHYAITPSELRLCEALGNGATLKHCALHWNRSYDTLRSQLKNILAKTGTHRQSDLLRLILAFQHP